MNNQIIFYLCGVIVSVLIISVYYWIFPGYKQDQGNQWLSVYFISFFSWAMVIIEIMLIIMFRKEYPTRWKKKKESIDEIDELAKDIALQSKPKTELVQGNYPNEIHNLPYDERPILRQQTIVKEIHHHHYDREDEHDRMPVEW